MVGRTRPGISRFSDVPLHIVVRYHSRPGMTAQESLDCFASLAMTDNRRRSIHEHHGLAAIEDHAILQMMPHGTRQHAPLDIAALAHEIIGRVAMADALDVLVDD